MTGITTLSEHGSFGGVQGFYRHHSSTVGLPMKFGVYRPPQCGSGVVPSLFYLAGLTCTEETFAIKGGAQQHASRHAMMLVTPDTSPRDTGIAGATADWEFAEGAGFYLDATRDPWCRHWQMASYVADELVALVSRHFGADTGRIGIFGHSMGGHGALTLGLKRPDRFRSVSAFAPVAAPMRSPWGVKAFSRYFGEDRAAWQDHDATELVDRGVRAPPLLIDLGLDDPFLATQLGVDAFEAACRTAKQPLALRRHTGYDHGYYFIASFVADHIAHHAATLNRQR